MAKKGNTVAHHARQAESRKRKIEIETPLPLIDAILDASADNLAEVEAAFHADIYGGGIAENDYPRHLYAPGLKSLTDLPPALLDTKEALPPIELIPNGSRALDTFLRRLVLIGITDAELALVTADWPAQASTLAPWLHHVMRVWAWHDRNPALYKALVAGRFGLVIRHLRRLIATKPELAATLRRDLHVQSLIWCAHDVQMVVARIAIGDAVFGPLVTSDQLKLSPEGVRNRLVGRRRVLETILDLLYRSPDWRKHDLPLPDLAGTSDDPVTRDPLVTSLGRRIELRASAKSINVDVVATQLASRLGAIAARLRENGSELEVSLSPTDEEKKQRSLPSVWYGLSPVAAATVPILRLVQAEQQMPLLIDELVPVVGTRPELRDGTALPPFDPDVLKKWHERARLLLDLYRRRLLRDVDCVRMEDKARAEKKARATASGQIFRETDNSGISLDPWKAMGAAQDFLKTQGQRRIEDHHGDQHDQRRTLYLLDVVPEHRLAAGNVKVAIARTKRNG